MNRLRLKNRFPLAENAARTDVQQTWLAHGWRPRCWRDAQTTPARQMQQEKAYPFARTMAR